MHHVGIPQPQELPGADQVVPDGIQVNSLKVTAMGGLPDCRHRPADRLATHSSPSRDLITWSVYESAKTVAVIRRTPGEAEIRRWKEMEGLYD
jgi:hypothetical protein